MKVLLILIMFQNILKNLVFFFALTLTAQHSYGAFILAPSVGYKMQTIKLTDNLDSASEFKASNPVFGLKLGFLSASGVSLDIAGSYVSGKGKATSGGSSTEVSQDFTEQSAAVQFGISTNTFKIYLGYLLMNEAKIKKPGSDVTYKGPGYQAGLAFHLTSALSLGVQYQIDQYNQIKFDALGSSFDDIKNYYKKVDSQSTTINLTYSF